MNPISELEAIRAYAKMINTLEPSHLASMLPDDFHYASQWVMDEITDKSQYMAYITGKITTLKENGQGVWAEIGRFHSMPWGHDFGVILAQKDKRHLVATVFAGIEKGVLKRFDMCCVPPPEMAERTGEYPGIAQ